MAGYFFVQTFCHLITTIAAIKADQERGRVSVGPSILLWVILGIQKEVFKISIRIYNKQQKRKLIENAANSVW